MKTACISGINGQIGAYLTSILLNEGYSVYGLKRRTSSLNTERLDEFYSNPNLHLYYGDVCDPNSLTKFIGDVKPDLYFSLASQSHVKTSFELPCYTFDCVAGGTINTLEVIKNVSPKTRFLHSASSEMFGAAEIPQSEKSLFIPQSPYAIAKIAAFYATKNYRESYKMFCCNSICFNMESKKRLETFVTRKITRIATKIAMGLEHELRLGDTSSQRDWQHASDGANAMYMIINNDVPKDFVVGTGQMFSVQYFLEKVFEKLNLDWKKYVVIDQKYFRPTDVHALQADASKIKKELGWEPKYDLNMIIDEMVSHDLKLAQQELLQKQLQNLSST